MNKEDKIRMENMVQTLKQLENKILLYAKKGIPIETELSVSNTGLTEGPFNQGWKQYYDLGAREFTITLSFPNNKTLIEAINND